MLTWWWMSKLGVCINFKIVVTIEDWSLYLLIEKNRLRNKCTFRHTTWKINILLHIKDFLSVSRAWNYLCANSRCQHTNNQEALSLTAQMKQFRVWIPRGAVRSSVRCGYKNTEEETTLVTQFRLKYPGKLGVADGAFCSHTNQRGRNPRKANFKDQKVTQRTRQTLPDILHKTRILFILFIPDWIASNIVHDSPICKY